MYDCPQLPALVPCLSPLHHPVTAATWKSYHVVCSDHSYVLSRPKPVVPGLQMSPGLPHAVEGAAVSAQLQLESIQDMSALTTFSERVKAWSEPLNTLDNGAKKHDASAHIAMRGEDGIERPCCAFVRPLQLGRSAPVQHIRATYLSCKFCAATCQHFHTLCCISVGNELQESHVLPSALSGKL